MTFDVPLEQPTALNLTLHGSSGRFRIGRSNGEQQSLEVLYFLTNVGLALGQGTNDALLSELAPVREIFRVPELGFDELMQRDIDDARVTSELIPYLLDPRTAGMVKLFPPIVVALLPTESGNASPLRCYPPVWQGQEQIDTDGYSKYVVRSGPPGAEVFQLEQPMVNGHPLDHDRVRLKINTFASRLVIVDGQHRAMALLAVFRNLRDQWSNERRRPYRDYYKEWTPEYIAQFDLSQVQLPVMIFVVPELTEGFSGDFDLIRAARQVFLTLNKTARKVSDSRNRLLDDNDLMAVFLRRVLEAVKSRSSSQPTDLRIHHVELDQSSDNTKVTSKLALTGVNHIYYIIEHLMLDGDDVHGIGARGGRFASRKSLDNCLPRLNGRDILGEDAASSIRRHTFASGDGNKLAQSFFERYGQYMVHVYDTFRPFRTHNEAVYRMDDELREDPDSRLKSILFEGQGLHRTFTEYQTIVKRRRAALAANDPEEQSLRRLIEDTEALGQRLTTVLDKLSDDITASFLRGALEETAPRTHSLKKFVKEVMYNQYYSSVAFQAALFGTFFGELERVNRQPGKAVNADGELEQYLTKLSGFFQPSSKARLEDLLRVFGGEIVGEGDDPWVTVPSDSQFRQVVYRGEMQPDQWPKLRYLMLELWEPLDRDLAGIVNTELTWCRKDVVVALYRRLLLEKARDRGIGEADLSQSDREAASVRAVQRLSELISRLGSTSLDKNTAMTWTLGPPPTTVDESEAGDL